MASSFYDQPLYWIADQADGLDRPGLYPPDTAALCMEARQVRLAEMIAGMTLAELEQIAIAVAVEQAFGSLPAAARRLGVSPSTLYRKREQWVRQDPAGLLP